MAIYRLSLLPLLIAMVGGCTQQLQSSSISPPDLGGPRIAASHTPAYTPPATPSHNSSTPAAGISGIPQNWIPNVPSRPWKWIVIHHSASSVGSATSIDKIHRAQGWDELGYHWVIGNGSETADGQIEVGSRWTKQKWGAHAKTPDNRYNDYGIGICLVGNFDLTRPSAAQMRSLAKLVAYLMKTYHITPDRVIGHRDTKPTHCPGANMDIAVVRSMAQNILANSPR